MNMVSNFVKERGRYAHRRADHDGERFIEEVNVTIEDRVDEEHDVRGSTALRAARSDSSIVQPWSSAQLKTRPSRGLCSRRSVQPRRVGEDDAIQTMDVMCRQILHQLSDARRHVRRGNVPGPIVLDHRNGVLSYHVHRRRRHRPRQTRSEPPKKSRSEKPLRPARRRFCVNTRGRFRGNARPLKWGAPHGHNADVSAETRARHGLGRRTAALFCDLRPPALNAGRASLRQSNISTVRATSPAFIARNASLTSSSLPRRLTISSSFSRPWR